MPDIFDQVADQMYGQAGTAQAEPDVFDTVAADMFGSGSTPSPSTPSRSTTSSVLPIAGEALPMRPGNLPIGQIDLSGAASTNPPQHVNERALLADRILNPQNWQQAPQPSNLQLDTQTGQAFNAASPTGTQGFGRNLAQSVAPFIPEVPNDLLGTNDVMEQPPGAGIGGKLGSAAGFAVQTGAAMLAPQAAVPAFIAHDTLRTYRTTGDPIAAVGVGAISTAANTLGLRMATGIGQAAAQRVGAAVLKGDHAATQAALNQLFGGAANGIARGEIQTIGEQGVLAATQHQEIADALRNIGGAQTDIILGGGIGGAAAHVPAAIGAVRGVAQQRAGESFRNTLRTVSEDVATTPQTPSEPRMRPPVTMEPQAPAPPPDAPANSHVFGDTPPRLWDSVKIPEPAELAQADANAARTIEGAKIAELRRRFEAARARSDRKQQQRAKPELGSSRLNIPEPVSATSTPPAIEPAPAEVPTAKPAGESGGAGRGKPSLIERIDAAGEAAAKRLSERGAMKRGPKGTRPGASTLPDDLIDLATVAAARAIKAGATTVKAVREIITTAAKELGHALGKGEDQQALQHTMKLVRAHRDGGPDGFERAVGESRATEPSVNPKAAIAESTGLKETPEAKDLGVKMKAAALGIRLGDGVKKGERVRVDLDVLKTAKRGQVLVVEPTQAGQSNRTNRTNLNTSLGITAPTAHGRTLQSLMGIGDTLAPAVKELRNRTAGRSLPAIQAHSPESAQAAATFGTAKTSAKPVADDLIATVTGGRHHDRIFDTELGSVLVEDQLRGIRNKYLERAADAAAKGDTQGEADALAAAAAVKSTVGSKTVTLANGQTQSIKKRFSSEQEYQDLLARPDIAEAIERHKSEVQPLTDAMYSDLQNGDVGHDARGEQTGAFINLLPIRATGEVLAPGRAGNLENAKIRGSAFATEATGTGEYDPSYARMIGNRFTKDWPRATMRKMFDQFRADGIADVVPIDSPNEINGQPATTAITPPEFTKRYAGEGNKIIIQSKYAGEVRRLLNVDQPAGGIVRLIGKTTGLAIQGAVEPLVHSVNILVRTTTAPGDGSLNRVLTAAAVPTHTVTRVAKLVGKYAQIVQDTPEIRREIRKLAELGALRSTQPGERAIGKFLHHADTAGRLVLSDLYDAMVREGIAPNSPNEKREYITQRLGQYHAALQSGLAVWMKGKQWSPFYTASTTMTRGATFHATGVPAFRPKNRGQYAQMVAEKVLGLTLLGVVLPTVANRAITGTWTGRPGTPIGAIDLGNDKDGKDRGFFDPLKLSGYRRGFNALGITAGVKAAMEGGHPSDVVDDAARQSIRTIGRSFAGPAPEAAYTAATGRDLLTGDESVRPQKPGDSVTAARLKQAALQINPMYEAAYGHESAPDMSGKAHAIGDEFLKTAKSMIGLGDRRPRRQAMIERARQKAYRGQLYRDAMKK